MKTNKRIPSLSVPEIAPMKKYVAELIGTMVLVLMGCGSAVIAGQILGVQYAFLAIALALVSLC